MHNGYCRRVARFCRGPLNTLRTFYGATDIDTCVAEIRPPVGSYIVAGEFSVTREIRVLDLERMRSSLVKMSPFHPDYEEHAGRVAFLKRLVSIVTMPVLPGEKDLEFLPTQALAEFLAHHIEPRIDGMLYPSSQTSDKGMNLVLFNHASGVDTSALPDGHSLQVDLFWGQEEGDLMIFLKKMEYQTEIASGAHSPQNTRSQAKSCIKECGPAETNREPTLQLNMSRLSIIRVLGVNYKRGDIIASFHG